MAKQRYNFLIDESVYKAFSRICQERGLVRSKQIELFMREFLKKRQR